MRDFRIISVDDHLVQPADLWQSRLPARWRDRGPRVVEGAGGDGRAILASIGITFEHEPGFEPPPGDAWVYDGRVFETTGLSISAGNPGAAESPLTPYRYADLAPELYDPAARAKLMDADGVLASVCFPMSEFPRFCGQAFMEGPDKELGLACIRAFNEYIIEEWSAGAPGRFVPLILVPLWDPELAAREAEHWAGRGAKAIAFSEDPYKLGLPSIHDSTGAWDPLFAVASETGMPICIHIGSGSWTPPGPPEQPLMVNLANTEVLSSLAAYDWLMSGVLVRFPGLKLVLSEGGIGWIPHVLDHADYVWERHGSWARTKLPDPPSTYFRQNMYGCFIHDQFGAEHIRSAGIENCMLETDFPHADSSYPHTLDRSRERLAYLTDEELFAVTKGNAARLFGLDLATHEAA